MIDWFGNLTVLGKIGWTFLGLVLLGFVLSLFFFGLRKLGAWQTLKNIEDDKDRISLKIEIIKTTASILGGMFFILTIVVAFLNYRVTQEKHTTDLFTKAIEQLGSEKLEVKLGGIYALERIARESEKDHWPIMEVLTAYVRENAPWPPQARSEARKKLPWVKVKDTDSSLPEKKKGEGGEEIRKKPDTDIEAILAVLGRRERRYEKREDQRLDLRETDLRGADLRGTHLERAIFEEAHLEGADLREAHLERAVLWKAYLEEANIYEAHLDKANLGGTNLERANLEKAHLEGAYLRAANLKGAFLKEAHLEEAKFYQTHLERADLSGAHLKWAELLSAHLEGANLGGAYLERAKLKLAHLEGAKLGHAYLERADLSHAHLKGTDFSGAHLQGADFWRALNLEKDQVIEARCWPLAFFDAKLLKALRLPSNHIERLRNKDLERLHPGGGRPARSPA